MPEGSWVMWHRSGLTNARGPGTALWEDPNRTAQKGGEVEVHPGVFVSNVTPEQWHPDPEIGGGAEEHTLVDAGTLRAGLSRFSEHAELPDPLIWALPATEILVILEGEARIEIEDGPALELKPGDMACLPKGAVTTWQITRPFKELWVLVE